MAKGPEGPSVERPERKTYNPENEQDYQKMLKLAATALEKMEWDSELQPLVERAKAQLGRLATDPTAKDESLLSDAAKIKLRVDENARAENRDADTRRHWYSMKSQADALISIASGKDGGIQYWLLGYHSDADYERVFGQQE